MSSLPRVVGLPGAVLLGAGSIVGTGVFVSLGVAAGVAGPGLVLAVAIAAAVATCNALSSAQLAAAHPVSGGTYEYGYRYLRPWLGFAAGWTFLAAKSASAATAALGFAGYALRAAGVTSHAAQVGLALAAVAILTGLVASGTKRSAAVNAVIVSITLAALGALVAVGAPAALAHPERFRPIVPAPRALLEASALVFVAFTGYGRIATLGEEVRDPARTIPRAIVLTLIGTAVLYLAVAAAAVGLLGADGLAAATRATAAPLEVAARASAAPALAGVVALGAITAMLGVLLNLLLGLSRVVLAMARRDDLPGGLAQIDAGTPRRAVVLVGALIAGLVLVGDVKATWSFSAMTVLVYYALTNAAALALPAADRRYPPALAAIGLVACLGLAAFVELRVFVTGGALIGAGLGYHALRRAIRR